MKNIFFILVLTLMSQSVFSMRIYSKTKTVYLNIDCKLIITYFWNDNDTPSDPTDDIFMGSDVIKVDMANSIKDDELLLNPYFSFLNEEMKRKYGFDKPVYYSDFIANKKKLKKKVEPLKKITIEPDNPPVKTVRLEKAE